MAIQILQITKLQPPPISSFLVGGSAGCLSPLSEPPFPFNLLPRHYSCCFKRTWDSLDSLSRPLLKSKIGWASAFCWLHLSGVSLSVCPFSVVILSSYLISPLFTLQEESLSNLLILIHCILCPTPFLKTRSYIEVQAGLELTLS